MASQRIKLNVHIEWAATKIKQKIHFRIRFCSAKMNQNEKVNVVSTLGLAYNEQFHS